MGAGTGGVKDKDIDQLLITATACLVEARQGSTPTPALLQESLEALVQVVGRQQARIAALERQRPGPPLEGTGPLPLERKGG